MIALSPIDAMFGWVSRKRVAPAARGRACARPCSLSHLCLIALLNHRSQTPAAPRFADDGIRPDRYRLQIARSPSCAGQSVARQWWYPTRPVWPYGCGPIASRRLNGHRGRNHASPSVKRTNVIAIIGTFTKNENGFFGTIKTLSLDVHAKLVPTPKDSEKGPDFRVLVGNIEFGAGWKNLKNGNFVSICLDDPSFGAAIYANLVEANDSNYILIWSRRSAA
jgi:uncharacterized protein (DUF736 family)